MVFTDALLNKTIQSSTDRQTDRQTTLLIKKKLPASFAPACGWRSISVARVDIPSVPINPKFKSINGRGNYAASSAVPRNGGRSSVVSRGGASGLAGPPFAAGPSGGARMRKY